MQVQEQMVLAEPMELLERMVGMVRTEIPTTREMREQPVTVETVVDQVMEPEETELLPLLAVVLQEQEVKVGLLLETTVLVVEVAAEAAEVRKHVTAELVELVELTSVELQIRVEELLARKVDVTL